MSQFSILVVDDEPNICDLIEEWLKPAGHAVRTARTGTEALKLVGAQRFDLVVTDILMPDGDGLKVMEGVRKARPTARVLAISGGGRYMDGQEYLKLAQGLGADAAIRKPFTREQFLEAIAQAIAAKPAPSSQPRA